MGRHGGQSAARRERRRTGHRRPRPHLDTAPPDDTAHVAWSGVTHPADVVEPIPAAERTTVGTSVDPGAELTASVWARLGMDRRS